MAEKTAAGSGILLLMVALLSTGRATGLPITDQSLLPWVTSSSAPSAVSIAPTPDLSLPVASSSDANTIAVSMEMTLSTRTKPTTGNSPPLPTSLPPSLSPSYHASLFTAPATAATTSTLPADRTATAPLSSSVTAGVQGTSSVGPSVLPSSTIPPPTTHPSDSTSTVLGATPPTTPPITSPTDLPPTTPPIIPPITSPTDPSPTTPPIIPPITSSTDPSPTTPPIIPPITSPTDPPPATPPIIPPITSPTDPPPTTPPIIPPITSPTDPSPTTPPIMPSITSPTDPYPTSPLPSITPSTGPAAINMVVLVGGVTGVVILVMVLTLCILVFCIVTLCMKKSGRYTVKQEGARRGSRTEAYRPSLDGLNVGTLQNASALSATEEGDDAVKYESIRRTSGPLCTIRMSQQGSLYATVGPPPSHQPVTMATSLSDPDTVRLSDNYDLPVDVHVHAGRASGRASNVYEVPHDVMGAALQLRDSRSSNLYETVTQIRPVSTGRGTRQSNDSAVGLSPLQDLEAPVARGYETPQSAQERYSRELEELAQSDPQDDDSTGYERPVDLRSALSLSVSSGRGLSASPYEVARQSSDACEMMAGRYATLEHAEEEGEVEEREEEDIDTDEHFWQPPDTEEELYATLERKRYSFVPQESVRLLSKIGEGHFASVSLGSWFTGKGRLTQVAVKQLKPTASAEWRVKFLQEAAIMGQFHHQNIVKMFGVVQMDGEEDNCAILLELLPNGDLKHHLLDVKHCVCHHQKDPHTVATDLLTNAQQIASGMNYLANKDFVHRDLAARNILLDAEYVCKIGDFGMSRDLSEKGYYRATDGQVPIKWTAPEAMAYKKFTSACDVWSYGCLLYEMWSLGGRPLPGVKLEQTYRELMAGYRSPPPPGCTRGIYKLMIECWHPDPTQRPKFSEIHSLLHSRGEELLMPEEEDELEEPTPTVTDSSTLQWQLGGTREEDRDNKMFLDLQTMYRDTHS